MPDERTYEFDPEIESLLAELDADDLVLVRPPADVWSGIERQLADEPAPVLELASRRTSRFSPSALLSIAAAFVLVVVGVAVVLNRTSGDETVLATADLVHDADAFDPLGADATATARLVERSDGFVIVLDETAFPNVDDADLELWLIEAADDGTILDVAPVSLIDGAGSFEVPATLDVTTHRIVDISIEPRDGDDAHSGRSILRGTLEA